MLFRVRHCRQLLCCRAAQLAITMAVRDALQ